jgi:hypothetical protein
MREHGRGVASGGAGRATGWARTVGGQGRLIVRYSDPRLSHKDTSPRFSGELSDVASALHARVEEAATAAVMTIAPWLRHMARRITMADFPASWQEARSEQRSHDSRAHGKRFMLRVDSPSEMKLQQLMKQFGASKAEMIRQLIAQATPEDFPMSSQMKVDERRAHQGEAKASSRARTHRATRQ